MSRIERAVTYVGLKIIGKLATVIPTNSEESTEAYEHGLCLSLQRE
jgi:hypothetical protein